jgi:type I restriction enzyme, S subunit
MIADLKPYPTMKDSGLAWLREIPEHWDVRRGKVIFRCIDVRSVSGDEELLTVSSERGVVPRRTARVTMFKAESYAGYKLCWPGDLVINSLWAWGRGLGVSRHHGIVSSAYGVYRPRPAYTDYSNYIHELVRSVPFNWELHVRSKGIWISRLQLTDEAFLEAPFPLPPLSEQAAIVRFLDHADRRIRRYIRAKQKLITLLEEQKRAVIHRAVTNGVDPNVASVASGSPWFPSIPSHWSVLPMRRVIYSAIDGPHFSPAYLDAGIPFLSARNVKADGWSLGDVKYISEEDFVEFSRRVKPELGDVLYTKGGTTGVAHAVDLSFPFQVWVHIAVLKVNRLKIDPDYLATALNSPRCYEQSQLFTRGATNQDLGLGRMKDIELPIPPTLAEQRVIVEHLRAATSQVLDAIGRARREIELFREYRSRLVADVVTGKLDVHDAAARLPVEVDEVETLDEGDTEEDTYDDLDTVSEEAEA